MTGLEMMENTIWPPETPSNLPRDDPFIPHIDWYQPPLTDYDDLSYSHSTEIRTFIVPRPDYLAFDSERRTLRGGDVTPIHFPSDSSTPDSAITHLPIDSAISNSATTLHSLD